MNFSALRQTVRQQRWTLLAMLGLLGAACLGVWLPVPSLLKLVAATLLAFFLPGWLLLQAVDLTLTDLLERLTLAIALSYGLTVVISLSSLYLAGHLSTLLLSAVLSLSCLALIIITLFLALRSPLSAPRSPLSAPRSPLFALPLLVAVFFSFTNLGYADYWGDEMNGLLRAISAISGRPETLLEHTKGPVEILLPAVFGLLAGRFEPFTLRFPFALAYTVGVGGFYILGTRLFERKVGLLAALILAINGLYLAFGRMVQYQAVVFLMSVSSLALVYDFYESGRPQPVENTEPEADTGHHLRRDRGKYLILSLFLAGIGLLAHFDMLLILPPVGYLIWRRYGRHWPQAGREWLYLAGALVILLGVTASFYVPFLLNAQSVETSSYLSRRIIGNSNWPGNNFDQLYMFAVMYNSRYYVVLIAVLGAGVILADVVTLLRYGLRDRWLTGLVALAAIGAVLAVIGGRASLLPLLVSLLLLVMLLRSPFIKPELKLVYLWIGVAFIGYVFLVDYPRTHLRIIYPGWSLLVALAIVKLGAGLQSRLAASTRRWVMSGGTALLAVLWVLLAAYQYLLFVDREREYIFTYPEHKQSFYWEDPDFPFGSRRLYGAPHRLGWQMIHQLYAQGELQGDWDSNDDGSNLFWYTLGAPRNPCYPRYYFRTQFRQREEDIESPSFDEADYVHIGQVWNNNRLQIDIYEFWPTSETELNLRPEPAHYSVAVMPADFYTLPFEEAKDDITHPLPDPPLFRPSPTALAQIAEHYGDPRIVNVRDTVALAGYDLTDTWAEPGGLITVTLHWQAAEVVNLPYKIFVHLEGNGSSSEPVKLWAQADDFPACGTRPTNRWPVGETLMDRHVLRLPADMPPGEYQLRVGLYEPQTGLRMDLLDSLGNPQGISFDLTDIVIRPGT